MHALSVNLNLPALLGRINRTLEEVSRFVSAALQNAASLSIDSQRIDPHRPSIEFNSGLSWSDEEARTAWKQWILRNGFRDIAELISSILEEAHSVLTFYSLLDKQQSGVTLTTADVSEREKELKRFHRLSLADKLAWLKAQPAFSLPDEKLEEINSINVARNCLSHRSGVVGPKDLTTDGKLVVLWLGMDTIIESDGREFLFEGPVYLEKGGTVCLRLTRRSKEFALGARIQFDEREFPEIAWTIFAFAQTVASQLEASGKSRGIEFSQPPV